jgi:hypothetical protein
MIHVNNTDVYSSIQSINKPSLSYTILRRKQSKTSVIQPCDIAIQIHQSYNTIHSYMVPLDRNHATSCPARSLITPRQPPKSRVLRSDFYSNRVLYSNEYPPWSSSSSSSKPEPESEPESGSRGAPPSSSSSSASSSSSSSLTSAA